MALTPPPALDLPESLDGPRLRLRPFQPDDAPAVWEAVNESRERLAAWLPWVRTYHSLDDARAFVRSAQERWVAREDLTIGIFQREGERFLGGSGLHRVNWALRSFEIGYWLRQSAEGHGYMHEAVLLLTRFAFEALEARRVQILMDPRNLRSRHVAERAGYLLEGTLRHWAFDTANLPSDRHVFAVIREDYQRLRAGIQEALR